MKNKIILLLIIFISIIYVILVINKNTNIQKDESNNILQTIAKDTGYVIQNKNYKYENSKLEIYYPVTNYQVLNNEINKFIETDTNNFKKEVKNTSINDEYIYNLNFDYYETKSNITIVFHSFINIKLAHPLINVKTINYNKEIDKIETIYNYIERDEKFIDKVKKEVYSDLVKNNIYKDETLKKYLKESLNSGIDIFKDYIVTEEGITFIFKQYKVAPYIYGELQSSIKL